MYKANENSVLSCFIAGHPADWRERISEYHIGIKEYLHYAIFNYQIGCDFSDPLVQESRGIILDTETGDVVCWPFRKFGNYTEPYADSIDWSTAHAQEKVDGSIMKLWYPPRQDFETNFSSGWQISSNGVICPSGDVTNGMVKQSFTDLFKSADNCGCLIEKLDTLDKNSTYLFELVSPENRIVILYPATHLYHIGTRNNKSGQEYNVDIGITKPKEYPLHTLEDCINAANCLNRNMQNITDVENEGFVVVDADWHRVKIKSPEYLVAHHAVCNVQYSKKHVIRMFRSGTVTAEDLCSFEPEHAGYFRFYEMKMKYFEKKVEAMVDIVRDMYEKTEHDRREVAETIKRNPLAMFGFKAIGNDMTAEEMLDELSDAQYEKFIPDYDAPPEHSPLDDYMIEGAPKYRTDPYNDVVMELFC